jgi:hypothetical protein
MQKYYILLILLALTTKFGIYVVATKDDKITIPAYKSNHKKIDISSITTNKKEINVVASVYHPTGKQTDSSPTITANKSVIDTNKLKLKQIRWVALSWNLFKKNGGEFRFNDVIIVKSKFREINGEWIIKDVLPSRKNGIDFLQHPKTGFYGLYKNVTIKIKA